jgi:MEMO1 family protein
MDVEEFLQEASDDDDFADEAAVILPLADDENSPIPALRECTAQVVNVGAEEAGADPTEGGEEQAVVLLEDPEGFASKPVVLRMWAYMTASLFDGHNTAVDISARFTQRFGQPLPTEHILELQKELDGSLLLYSRKFERTLRRRLESYLESDTRAAMHAGQAYPSDKEDARKAVMEYFTTEDGPGAAPDVSPAATDTVRAMILPHIDLQVGGATYAHGYNEILSNSQADLFVILGVSHHSNGQGLYYVSSKNYETPFGTVKTEKAIARRLQEAAGLPVSQAELAHRTEHSIEFQALLLAGLMQHQKRDFEIVPVLCGAIEWFLMNDTEPFEAPPFKSFVQALRRELDASGRKWCILASVDLSHVGPEFGHSAMVTERMLPPVRRGDQRFLKQVLALDARGAYGEIARTQNSRHIDAVLSVMTMLEVCNGKLKSGRLLHYDQMLKESTHSAVSYAAAAFEASDATP